MHYATTGTFLGQFLEQLKPAKELSVVPAVFNFSSVGVRNEPDNIDRMILSNDHQYLYDIGIPISLNEWVSELT